MAASRIFPRRGICPSFAASPKLRREIICAVSKGAATIQTEQLWQSAFSRCSEPIYLPIQPLLKCHWERIGSVSLPLHLSFPSRSSPPLPFPSTISQTDFPTLIVTNTSALSLFKSLARPRKINLRLTDLSTATRLRCRVTRVSFFPNLHGLVQNTPILLRLGLAKHFLPLSQTRRHS